MCEQSSFSQSPVKIHTVPPQKRQMFTCSTSRWFTAATDHLETHHFPSHRLILRKRFRPRKTKNTLFLPLCILLSDVGKTSERWMRVSRLCLLWPLSEVPASTQPAKPPYDECAPARPLGEQTSLKSAEERKNSGLILEIFIQIEWFEFISATYTTSQFVHAVVCLPVQSNSGCVNISLHLARGTFSPTQYFSLIYFETWSCMSVYKTILFLVRPFVRTCPVSTGHICIYFPFWHCCLE